MPGTVSAHRSPQRPRPDDENDERCDDPQPSHRPADALRGQGRPGHHADGADDQQGSTDVPQLRPRCMSTTCGQQPVELARNMANELRCVGTPNSGLDLRRSGERVLTGRGEPDDTTGRLDLGEKSRRHGPVGIARVNDKHEIVRRLVQSRHAAYSASTDLEREALEPLVARRRTERRKARARPPVSHRARHPPIGVAQVIQ